MDDYEARLRQRGLEGPLIQESLRWSIFSDWIQQGVITPVPSRRVAAADIDLTFPDSPVAATHSAKGHAFLTDTHFIYAVRGYVRGKPIDDEMKIIGVPLTTIKYVGPSRFSDKILCAGWDGADGSPSGIFFTLSGMQSGEADFVHTWTQFCQDARTTSGDTPS
ncbi:hypothetical protein [Streptomyces sp. HPF1205]|uniref:hypothetical protein n=1 Tax=Streptomyces sp. HPF1205 TaxID=2873262 RepID=UPI001CED160C|nr:hypothetical protein [Streptomyces sp. HPF1205]